jgi:hypothetical protein
MPENKQIKDGLGNLFGMRMHDISPTQDGSLMRTMLFATAYPIDYGGGGVFQHCGKSNVILAGMPANSPIYSFRWTSGTELALIQRARIDAWSNTLFASGLATFDLFAARNWTAADTGGTGANLAGDVNQLRTSMGASGAQIMYANTGTLTAGTRTLDPAPLESRTVSVPNAANAKFGSVPLTLFEKLQGEHPLTLALNEGFVVRCSLPADGAWLFSLTLEWAEVPAF